MTVVGGQLQGERGGGAAERQQMQPPALGVRERGGAERVRQVLSVLLCVVRQLLKRLWVGRVVRPNCKREIYQLPACIYNGGPGKIV